MRKISGAVKRVPLWGRTFLVSMLVLIGVAPFSVFMSEFMMLKAAFSNGRYVLFALFLLGTIAIFISMLQYVLNMSFAGGHAAAAQAGMRVRAADKIMVVLIIAVLLVTGLWLTPVFRQFLESAALTVESGIRI